MSIQRKKLKFHIQTYDTLYYGTWNLTWVPLIFLDHLWDVSRPWLEPTVVNSIDLTCFEMAHTYTTHTWWHSCIMAKKNSYEVKGSLYFHQESLNNICPVEDRKNEYRGVEREMGWVSFGNTNPLSPSFPLFVSSRSLSPHLSFCSGQDDHQM